MLQRMVLVVCWFAVGDRVLSAEKPAAPQRIIILRDIRYRERASKQ